MPMWGNPLPWKKTELTPNLGVEDSTDDMRPGLGWTGVAHLADVRAERRSADHGRWTRPSSPSPSVSRTGVSAQRGQRLKVVGQRRAVEDGGRCRARSRTATPTTSRSTVERTDLRREPLGGGGGRTRGWRRRRPADRPRDGRRSRHSAGASGVEAPEQPKVEPWQAVPVTDEQLRNGDQPHPAWRSGRASILRYADARELLVSGLLEGGADIAQQPAVIDVPLDKGPRGPVLEQPDLARRDTGQLLPGVQRDPELRPAGRREEARPPVKRERLV